MKITKDSFGNTRIYPFADADAPEEAYFLSGCIEILTSQILRTLHDDNPKFGDIRLNMAFSVPIEAPRWKILNEGMEKAFEIQREAKKTQ